MSGQGCSSTWQNRSSPWCRFNHVGGGTKTRRPITLHMKYNPDCVEPRCYLITDDRRMKEEARSLEELQVGQHGMLDNVAEQISATS